MNSDFRPAAWQPWWDTLWYNNWLFLARGGIILSYEHS